jgi:hypothetical protein
MRRFNARIAGIVLLVFCAAHVFGTHPSISNPDQPTSQYRHLISISTVPGSSDPTGDEWPMFRGALNHTGLAVTTPAQGTEPLWTYTAGDAVGSSAAVSGGRVYVGCYDNKTYCLISWQYQ